MSLRETLMATGNRIKNRATARTAGIVAAMLLAFGPGRAAAALCALPGGNDAIPFGVTVLRGILVLGGVVLASSGDGGGGGDYGTSNKRKMLLAGVLVLLAGALLPQLIGFFLELVGSSAADVGLGCAF